MPHFPITASVEEALKQAGQSRRDNLGYLYHTFRVRLPDAASDWQALAKQAIGWHPDLNEGVRMNIRPFMSVPDVAKKGAGILRIEPNINWDKDVGKEPHRDKKDFPWFWTGSTLTGDRLNDVHLAREQKEKARK